MVSWARPASEAALMALSGSVPCPGRQRVRSASTSKADARLWDLSPDGKQTLVSRGVYRLAGTPSAPAGQVTFELTGNAWKVPAGDTLKLEITGADAPYFQPDSIPSVTNVSAATLELPVAA